MDMDFPSNSNISKKDNVNKPKVVEAVADGRIIQRPQTFGVKLKNVFFNGDFRGAAEYIVADVLLPAARDMIVDSSADFVQRLVYGETSRRAPRRGHRDYGAVSRPQQRTTYNSPAAVDRRMRDKEEYDRAPVFRKSNRRGWYEDVVVATREEANSILSRMCDIIDTYDIVSRADMYELAKIPTEPVDYNWGWDDLTDAAIRQTRNGFIIDVPQAEPIRG